MIVKLVRDMQKSCYCRKKTKYAGLIVFLLIIQNLLSGCYLIETEQMTETAIATTIPQIDLDQLPTLPTLAPEKPVETPIPQSDIYFETDSSIFSRDLAEQIPEQTNQIVRFIGTIAKIETDYFTVRHASGLEMKVQCGDFCFYVNDQKKLVDSDALAEGVRTAVFGTTSSENLLTVEADAVALYVKDGASKASNKTDMSAFPYQLSYEEFELKSAPEINPLKLKPVEGSLDANLAARLKTTLSDRTNYRYGLYGESYSTTLEYDQDKNRDPKYPTRANMSVESNSYPFYDFWFPHVDSPYFTNWGLISYGGDWYLPIRMTVDIDPDPTISEIIYSDRTIMSQMNFDRFNRYYRSFGFSIFSKSLFYFFENDKGYGISINRVDYPLGFDEIPFGLVDTYQELNPFYADDLITFFGRRGKTWYYVELKEKQIETGY